MKLEEGYLKNLREDYTANVLDETNMHANPVIQFKQWYEQATEAQVPEPNAFILATADALGMPDARVLLIKDVVERGFIFFTNYSSHKGMQMAENGQACMVFFWQPLQRQVRIRGAVEKVPEEESDSYFYSRPLGSRISAAASPQSKIVPNRVFLEDQVQLLTDKYGEQGPPRPPEWGGYLLKPARVEFWQGRSSRLHDRVEYRLLENGVWVQERLAP